MLIAVLMTFFIVYGMNINEKEYNENRYQRYLEEGQSQTFEVIAGEVVGSQVCIPVKVAAFLFAPLSILLLFGFLNHRNASDFYHGVVQKRECLCNSFALAAYSWTLLIMLSSFLTAVASVGLMKYVKFAKTFFAGTGIYMLEGAAIALFLIGVMVVAVSLSGTLLTNLTVAMMILFLPKVLYLVLMAGVVEDLAIYPYAYDDSILSGKYNLVTGLINEFLFRNEVSGLPAVLYTAVLGIILYVLGCIAFKLRKSEAATMAATSSRLQMLFRLIPAFVVTLVPCVYFYCVFTGTESWDDDYSVFLVVLFYVIAVVIYFLYEIITTRKWKNILRAVPGLAVLALCDVLFVSAMLLQREAILRDVPQNSSYVRILGSDSSSMYQTSYFSARMREEAIEDSTVIGILEESLKDNIEEIRQDSLEYYNKTSMLVEFRDNGRSVYRVVYVKPENEAYINRYLQNNWSSQIVTDIIQLPHTVNYIVGFNYSLTTDQMEQMLQAYMNGIDALPKDLMLDLIRGNYHDYIGKISVDVTYQGKKYAVNLPIYYQMECAADYIRLYNEKGSGTVDPLNQYLQDFKKYTDRSSLQDYFYGEIRFEYCSATDNDTLSYEEYYSYSDFDEMDDQQNIAMTALSELLENVKQNVYEAGATYVKVTYNSYGGMERYTDGYYAEAESSDGEYSRIYVLNDSVEQAIEDYLVQIR
jgi:ABC-2 type transport system permease protein